MRRPASADTKSNRAQAREKRIRGASKSPEPADNVKTRATAHAARGAAAVGLRGYYIDPLLLGPPSRWAPALDRCADMGFDTIVIAPPFESVLANDRFLVEDYTRCDARIGDMGAADMLSGVADVCASRNLILILDIAPDRCAASNPDVRENPHLYTLCAPPGTALPDPRAPSSTLLAAAARFGQDDAIGELQEIWRKRIEQWLGCGIGGFRCTQPARLPARAWRALIDAARG
ncbi:MAG: hypothetical protein WBW61_10630, partial [Rhodanobacteraceae bacterium]